MKTGFRGQGSGFRGQGSGFRIVGFLLLFLFCTLYPVPCTLTFAEDWKEHGSDHFIIFYTGDRSFANDVARNAEIYYKKIAVGLGYPRYSEFWTWNNRVKVYIYPDHAAYVEASEMPKWSHGMADYEKRIIMSYVWSEVFIDSILPHEIAHLIFRDFVGFTGKIPLWLDEGVAQWSEEKKRREMKELAKAAYEEDQLLSLDDLVELDIMRLKDVEKIYIRPTVTKSGDPATLILDTNSLVSSYYLVSVSLIDFLIERYGSARFAQFCRELRDKKSVEDALRLAYSEKVHNLKELENNWRKSFAEE
ncbi:MAG: hypothetical protein ABH875_05320 [Candidatus Omnitrophota bacterium]